MTKKAPFKADNAFTVRTICPGDVVGGSDFRQGDLGSNLVPFERTDHRPSEGPRVARIEWDEQGRKIVPVNTIPDKTGKHKDLGGSDSGVLNCILLEKVLNTLPSDIAEAEREALSQAVVDALRDIRPRNVIEGMLAAQMVATHLAAMECLRRAHAKDRHFDVWRENLNQGTKLSRTFAILDDALSRHRGKGQNVTVKYIHEQKGAVEEMVGKNRGSGTDAGEEQHGEETSKGGGTGGLRGADSDRQPVPIVTG